MYILLRYFYFLENTLILHIDIRYSLNFCIVLFRHGLTDVIKSVVSFASTLFDLIEQSERNTFKESHCNLLNHDFAYKLKINVKIVICL